jgi:membrane protein
MEEFSRKAAGLTSLGIVFLAFTALMLMLTIERAFNTIWRVFTMRPVAQRLVVYWALLSLGPLLVGGSLSVTSYLAGLSLGWLSGESLNHLGLLKLVPLLLTVAAFSLLYFAVPNRYVPLPHALAGGIIAALFFEMMKKGFTVYITKFTSFMLIYGAFAAIPIFLLWIYFSWTVILFGALVAANLSHWHAGDWWKQKTAVHRFISLLRVLRLLYIAQRRGESIGMKQFHRDLKLSLDELEDVLKQLRSVQWVRRVGRDAWILVRDLEDIRLADVYHRFVFSAADAPILSEDDHLAGLFSDIAARQDEAMSISLKSLYSRS